MKKTILTFGLISGALVSLMMAATVPFADRIGFDKSEFVGYTVIVASMLLVFFGIRLYRDNVGNGHITFSKAFTIGIAITFISCIFYVVTWEVLYFHFLPGFMDRYSAYTVQKLQASGASPEVIQAQLQQMTSSSRCTTTLSSTPQSPSSSLSPSALPSPCSPRLCCEGSRTPNRLNRPRRHRAEARDRLPHNPQPATTPYPSWVIRHSLMCCLLVA
jgi:hypothetical protein